MFTWSNFAFPFRESESKYRIGYVKIQDGIFTAHLEHTDFLHGHSVNIVMCFSTFKLDLHSDWVVYVAINYPRVKNHVKSVLAIPNKYLT